MARTRIAGIGAALLMAACLSARAEPKAPKASLTAGVASEVGWLGGQGELYFAGGRASAFVGAGYAPRFSSEDENTPTGPAFAVGLRGFTRGRRHRGFVELMASMVDREWVQVDPQTVDKRKLYGPGLALGYQFVATDGFTFAASLGVGYAPGAETMSKANAVGGISMGYTWR